MPFLIKSSGGERVLSRIGDKNRVAATQDEIIEALRGLTFRFEVKIVDVERTSDCNESASQQPDRPDPESSGHKLTNGTTSSHAHQSHEEPDSYEELDSSEEPQVAAPAPRPTSTVAARVVPSPVKDEVDEASCSTNGIAKHQEQANLSRQSIGQQGTTASFSIPKLINEARPATLSKKEEEPKVRSKLNFAPLQVLKRQAEAIYAENGLQQPEANPQVDKENVKPSLKSLPRAQRIEAMMKIKKQVDTERAPISPKAKLIRGELSIGDTIDTCYLSSDESKNPPLIYITYNNDKLLQVTELMSKVTPNIESLPEPTTIDVGDFVVAKSKDDDTWYRSIVMGKNGPQVEIYFFDWGITENLDLSRIRLFTHAELEVTKNPACALKVHFTNQPKEPMGECEFTMRVESYDQYEEIYSATIISIN